MNDSEEIIELLKQINSNLGYIVASLPDLDKTEALLEKILKELKKK